MPTFLFCLHISAALLIGKTAYQRGRSFIVWTLLTLIPYGIFVTWPLLYILPRRNTEQPASVPLAAGAQIAQVPTNLLRLTTDNKSFFMGVTIWVVCLLILGIGIIGKPVTSPPAPKASTTQPLTPNVNDPRWVKDFTRRVIDACDLPLGNSNRPAICNLPR